MSEGCIVPCQFFSLWDEKPWVCPGKHVPHDIDVARKRRTVEQCRRKARAEGLHRLKRCPMPREAADPGQWRAGLEVKDWQKYTEILNGFCIWARLLQRVSMKRLDLQSTYTHATHTYICGYVCGKLFYHSRVQLEVGTVIVSELIKICFGSILYWSNIFPQTSKILPAGNILHWLDYTDIKTNLVNPMQYLDESSLRSIYI